MLPTDASPRPVLLYSFQHEHLSWILLLWMLNVFLLFCTVVLLAAFCTSRVMTRGDRGNVHLKGVVSADVKPLKLMNSSAAQDECTADGCHVCFVETFATDLY